MQISLKDYYLYNFDKSKTLNTKYLTRKFEIK